ncbi:hypothetical protein [Hymenobacter koreensis]|uniref:STAS/SEC14 domain-containing protein n=1 Tax=Hymenobacter koreensis TaxID=1084523 RepID=A0ABP8IU79_9BACT
MHLASPSALVELAYRPELHIVVVRWLGVTSEEEIRRVYASLEQAAVQQCRFWLLDARRRPSSSSLTTQWMLGEFAPKMARQLGGPLYFSYLISPVHLNAAEEFRKTQEAATGPHAPYQLHYAIQEGEATDWLLQMQRLDRVPTVTTAEKVTAAIS